MVSSDSGKDSGQKPRRPLHERVFHAASQTADRTLNNLGPKKVHLGHAYSVTRERHGGNKSLGTGSLEA
jgi:hypothetical protein